MMTGAITDDQARALAQLVALLSGDKRWDVAGVRSALSKARHRAPAHELAIAAIRCAVSPQAKTPAVIGMDGPHWSTPSAPGVEYRFARCPVIGHTSYAAHNCAACRSERIGADEPAPAPPTRVGLDPARVRQILASHTERSA